MLLAAWRSRVAAGELEPDPAQEAAAIRLDRLAVELEGSSAPRASGWRQRLGLAAPSPAEAPRGVYLHGGVGRGKSMLMDLFVDGLRVAAKRRVHFHAFMLEVQSRLHGLRERGDVEDPLRRLAADLAPEQRVLCFDELHVVNIADAMILARLFSGLFDEGVTMVATSNWPPDRLYENGLNRDLFLPFIELLRSRVDVVALDGPVDYRMRHLSEVPSYLTPADGRAAAALARTFALLTDDAAPMAEELAVGSRRLTVARAAGGVAWLTFAQLCAQPLGAADYLALSERYHTLLVEAVPVLGYDRRNEARRFMTLVDAAYERRTMLFVSAEAPPERLYAATDGAFEFQRTASRLVEMQGRAWLERCRSRADAVRGDFVPYALTSDLI